MPQGMAPGITTSRTSLQKSLEEERQVLDKALLGVLARSIGLAEVEIDGNDLLQLFDGGAEQLAVLAVIVPRRLL